MNLKVVIVKKTTLATLNAPQSIGFNEHSGKKSHLNKTHLSFGECHASVILDGFTVIARGDFKRDLQIKEGTDVAVRKIKT